MISFAAEKEIETTLAHSGEPEQVKRFSDGVANTILNHKILAVRTFHLGF